MILFLHRENITHVTTEISQLCQRKLEKKKIKKNVLGKQNLFLLKKQEFSALTGITLL